ncbi:MAG TPA: hypothetical protein VF138_12055 [Caulobacteraceae bacterium]
MSRALLLSLLLTSCAAPQAPARMVGTEADARPNFDAEMRATIRDQAQRDYAAECGTVTVPDSAIIPLELTGGGLPEYAVTFGRVECAVDGGHSTRWQGTGGPFIQFWIGSGGPPRIMLEQTMHGFSVTDGGLVAQQHGGFCPGGAGPNVCVVTYRWDDRTRRLEVVSRVFDETGSGLAPMRYGYPDLT